MYLFIVQYLIRERGVRRTYLDSAEASDGIVSAAGTAHTDET
jgi:hypothetical protein